MIWLKQLAKYAEKILEVWQCSIGNKDCKYSALCPFNRKTRNLVNQKKMILKGDLSASEELKNNSKTVINASESPC